MRKFMIFCGHERAFSRLVLLPLFLVFGAANGQEAGQKAVKIGEADLYPSLKLSFSNINNIYRRDTGEVEATGVVLEPEAVFVADKKGLSLTASYRGQFASFSESEFDYADHLFLGKVDAILTSKKRVTAGASISFDHEDLGTGLTRNMAAPGQEQVERLNFKSDFAYTYGAQTARLNLTGGLGFHTRTFRNRSDITAGRDHQVVSPYGQVSIRVSPDTRALLELQVRNFDYENSSLDRVDLQILTGLKFRGTGKSGGDIKFGFSQTNYSLNEASDSSLLVADIGLYLAPSTLSRFDLSYRRELDDTEAEETGGGISQTVDDIATLSWNKRWSGFLKTQVNLEYTNKDRECPDSTSQDFEIEGLVSIQPRTWLEIGAGVSNFSHKFGDCVGIAIDDVEYEVQKLNAFIKVSL